MRFRVEEHRVDPGYSMSRWTLRRRTVEAIGILLIGDGVIGAVIPARHSRRWVGGPDWWRRAMQLFIDYPTLTRTLALGELVLGLWLAIRD